MSRTRDKEQQARSPQRASLLLTGEAREFCLIFKKYKTCFVFLTSFSTNISTFYYECYSLIGYDKILQVFLRRYLGDGIWNLTNLVSRLFFQTSGEKLLKRGFGAGNSLLIT